MEQQTNKFDEVDGQFSMFSDEPAIKNSKPRKSQVNYESISNVLCKKKLAQSDTVLLQKILSSIDDAIKKRA